MTVLVGEASLPVLDDIVAALERAGLAVEGVQDVLGTVTGSVDSAVAGSLRDVPGVVDVEVQRDVGTR